MNDFFEKLGRYFESVAEAMKADAIRASIILDQNSTDVGVVREMTYARELLTHLPTNCCVRFGGFLFNSEGVTSNQMDILVLSDSVPQYNLLGKSFASLDGTIAVVEVKSNLNTAKLDEALEGFRSLPDKLDRKFVSNGEGEFGYEDWPYKIGSNVSS